jgi:hypothetical protein
MMEAGRTSETLVNFYQTTRCYNPEDRNLHTHRRENLKSYIRIKIYNTLASLKLLQRSENWTMKANDEIRFMATEMKFTRRTKYTWMDCKRNEDILKEPKM